MKFMNARHYGQSQIFGKARFMAEPDAGSEPEADVDVDTTGGGGADIDDADDEVESIDDLKSQLAKAKADYQKLKIQNDNNSRQAKQLKDQLRSRQSKEEQEQQDREEKFAELEALRREVQVSKYSKRYIGIGMDEKTSDEIAAITPSMNDDEANAFFDALSKHIKSVEKIAADNAVQKLLKERPEINAGGGDSDKNDPSMVFAKNFIGNRQNTTGANADILKNYM